MRIVPVILCGGEGRRLRGLYPLLPKPYLALADSRFSLLQQTAKRSLLFAAPEDVISVISQEYSRLTRKHLVQVDFRLTRNVLVEKQRRNTAAAVALALHHARDIYGDDAVMVVLPADHWIGDDEIFARQIREAASEAGSKNNNLLLFGIKPDYPSAEFGYIVAENGRVTEFVEKPDSKTAQHLITTKGAYWNSGIFVFSLGVGMDLYRRHAPEIWKGICNTVSSLQYADNIPTLPFDKAIVEKASAVMMQEAKFDWLDIGTPESLQQLRQKTG